MKYHGYRERGMSIIAIFFVLVLVACVGLFGLKLIPIYLEASKVDTALKGTIEQGNIAAQSVKDIRLALYKRLDIDDVRSINWDNMKDTVTITKQDGDVIIEVEYRREEPLFHNISVAADFEKCVDTNGQYC